MKTYDIILTRVVRDLLTAHVTIEASSPADAREKIDEMIENGKDFDFKYASSIDGEPIEVDDILEAETVTA